ncbi:MAG: hydrogenase iron-sulfur subunit [Anaerolineaceae bacterium]|nr:hydrogenase iron-sulfur subunit [Anaerolineaceae bacterium]
MSRFRKKEELELLPGAVLEEDCQTLPETLPPMVGDDEADDHDDHEHDVTWTAVSHNTGSGNLLASWQRKPASWAVWLERLTLWLERPFNKLTGTPQLNPFYHTGTIAVLLTLVVGLTGFYIFLFYKYGYEESYLAVLRMNDQVFTRTMRAVHRYASGALVVTTLLHAYRTLFMERFRGQRWLAWVTGIVLTIIIWFAGVTGYWLVVDARAQLITDGFVRFLRSFTPWADRFVLWLTKAEFSGETWPIMLILLTLHVVLFLVVAYFFYLHIRRLSRAKWLPDIYLVIGTMLVLVLVAIVFPLRNLPAANSVRLPASITLDPLFLFYLPAEGGGVAPWLWGGLLLITAVATLLPWLTKDRAVAEATGAKSIGLPVVNIVMDRCTGCTKCALDCPYGAIEMVERHDDKPHKFIAIADPKLCVSCGICVGSCDGVAVSLGDSLPELLWDAVAMRLTMAKAKAPEQPIRVVFTCDRHAAQGARPFLAQNSPVMVADTAVEIITVPCVGTLPPDMMLRALDAGAHDVQIIGCPPDDCRNREGNLWAEKRITRQRVPRLKRDRANAPITAAWVAPDDFSTALNRPLPVADSPASKPDFMSARRMFSDISPRSLVILFVMMVVVLLAQVFLTDLPFSSRQVLNTAVIRTMVDNPVAAYDHLVLAEPERPFTLRLELDGEILTEQTYDLAAYASRTADPFVAEHNIAPGAYHVRLAFVAAPSGEVVTLIDETTEFEPGDIWRVVYEPRGFAKNPK